MELYSLRLRSWSARRRGSSARLCSNSWWCFRLKRHTHWLRVTGEGTSDDRQVDICELFSGLSPFVFISPPSHSSPAHIRASMCTQSVSYTSLIACCRGGDLRAIGDDCASMPQMFCSKLRNVMTFSWIFSCFANDSSKLAEFWWFPQDKMYSTVRFLRLSWKFLKKKITFSP